MHSRQNFNASAEKIICFCWKKSVVWRQQSVLQSSIRFFEEWWAKEMGSKPMKRCVCSKRDMVRVGSIVCGRFIKKQKKKNSTLSSCFLRGYFIVFIVSIRLFIHSWSWVVYRSYIGEIKHFFIEFRLTYGLRYNFYRHFPFTYFNDFTNSSDFKKKSVKTKMYTRTLISIETFFY